jgi:hypothetical protein
MRRLITLLLIGLLGITGSVVSAQDTQYIYCGGLSDADCQLLNDAVTNLPNLHSAYIDLSVQFQQSNQDAPVAFMKFSGVLNGRLDPETFLSPISYATLLNDLNADLTIHLPASTEQIMSAGQLDHPLDIRFILKDDIFYLDLDSLQTVLNDASLPAWGCYDLKPGKAAQLKQSDTSENTTYVPPLLTGFDLQALSQTLGSEVAQKYAIVTRSEGNGLVTFETRLDLPGLYADPVYQEALRNQIETVKELAGWHVSKITDQHLERLAQAAATLFPEPLLVSRYTIDLKQGFMQSLYSWLPDEWYFSMRAAMQGKDTAAIAYSSVILHVDVSDFNQAVPVVVPTAAQPFDTAALDKVEILRGLIPAITGVQSSGLSGTCGG